jgi:hypothetical protein
MALLTENIHVLRESSNLLAIVMVSPQSESKQSDPAEFITSNPRGAGSRSACHPEMRITFSMSFTATKKAPVFDPYLSCRYANFSPSAKVLTPTRG